jgi:hypothetical protein
MGRDPGAEAVEQAVRDWIAREAPGEPALAANAARRAASAYLQGDTVSEACGAALCYVQSWYDHPSHRRVGTAAASLVS